MSDSFKKISSCKHLLLAKFSIIEKNPINICFKVLLLLILLFIFGNSSPCFTWSLLLWCGRIRMIQLNKGEKEYGDDHGKGANIIGICCWNETIVFSVLQWSNRHLSR